MAGVPQNTWLRRELALLLSSPRANCVLACAVFGIFLACLALGVAAIAAAGSTAEAFRQGLASASP